MVQWLRIHLPRQETQVWCPRKRVASLTPTREIRHAAMKVQHSQKEILLFKKSIKDTKELFESERERQISYNIAYMWNLEECYR